MFRRSQPVIIQRGDTIPTASVSPVRPDLPHKVAPGAVPVRRAGQAARVAPNKTWWQRNWPWVAGGAAVLVIGGALLRR